MQPTEPISRCCSTRTRTERHSGILFWRCTMCAQLCEVVLPTGQPCTYTMRLMQDD